MMMRLCSSLSWKWCVQVVLALASPLALSASVAKTDINSMSVEELSTILDKMDEEVRIEFGEKYYG